MKPNDETILGESQFVDGARRPVYLDAAGRQYVCNDNGEKVPGLWLDPSTSEPDDAIRVSLR